MDGLDVTGLVMTASLNSVITDSSPGMAAYATGQKTNNNQAGVFPDNTPDPFDNPRIEYLGELLRRTRGQGFHVGIVTTADVTDSTPAANAVHSADRSAGSRIAARFFDERDAVVIPTDPSRPFGNAARNSVRGPLFWQLDLAVSRRVALPRGVLELRAEFFNLFNRTNFRAPNGNRSAAAFGTITQAYDPRQVQLGAKLSF